ncbi:MAG TPA: flagellar hook-length control protein FliK [Pseudomonas sp.]|uniref:flagellar hook-length control protein FliK n=1 Tax=Pseudomonas sp. TaxID=306 RepID=UPI002CE31EF4|nr:flagellar hook-length control protein FliK [Pseudomonas sp.]HRL93308.1 flagellar hook-length control protein FliK [Pseudomonas sp.]
MAVAPDLLLQSAPEVKPRKAAARQPAETPQPRKNESSSFAQVYAKERQTSAVERHEGAAKSARNKSEAEGDAAPAEAQPGAEAAVVADSGNDLPVDSEVAAQGTEALEAELDPLLLFGMTGQVPLTPEETALTLEGTAAQAEEAVADAQSSLLNAPAVPLAGLVGNSAAAMTDASHDPTLDALNTLPGVRMALEIGAQAQTAAQQAGPTAGAVTAAISGDGAQAFAGTLAVLAEGAGEAESTLELGELDVAALEGEGLPEGATELRSDNLAGRLSALSQAIAQQTSASARPVLVPGQPLAMQQGGWSEAVVDKVMWLSSQNLKSAEIQLDPAELGRLEVRVDISKDQTQVTFASPHAGVRDTLEGQMQRLRDLFTQQGMNLLDVNVSDQSLSRGWQGQGQGQDGEGQRRGDSAPGLALGEEEKPLSVGELRSSTLSNARRLVDYYA